MKFRPFRNRLLVSISLVLLPVLLVAGEPAQSFGKLYLQNGDILPANLSRITFKNVQVATPYAPERVQINKQEAVLWARATDAPVAGKDNLDTVTLVSGQALKGTLQAATPEQLSVKMPWGQFLEIPSETVARVQHAEEDESDLLRLVDFTVRNRARAGTPLEWVQVGNTLFHPDPNTLFLEKNFTQSFQNPRLDLDLRFTARGEYLANWLIQSGNPEGGIRSLNLELRNGMLQMTGRDFLFARPIVPFPENLSPQKHIQITLEFDTQSNSINVWLNGEKKGTFSGSFAFQEGAILETPKIRTSFIGMQQVSLRSLSLRNSTSSRLAELNTLSLRLRNGDLFEPQKLSFQNETWVAELSGIEMPIPKQKVKGVIYRPQLPPSARSGYEVLLDGPFPRIHADMIDIAPSGVITLTVKGLQAPLKIHQDQLVSVQWRQIDALTAGQEDATVLHLKNNGRLTGDLLEVGSSSMLLKPQWHEKAFTLNLFEVEQVTFEGNARRDVPNAYTILRNGDYLAGELRNVSETTLELVDKTMGTMTLSTSEVRLLASGSQTAGNWVVDPLQAVIHTFGTDLNEFRFVSPSPDSLFTIDARFFPRQLIPAGSRFCRLHATLRSQGESTYYLSVQTPSLKGPEEKDFFNMNFSRTRIASGSIKAEGERVRLDLPPDLQELTEIEVLIDREKQGVRIKLNGRVFFEEEGLDLGVSVNRASNIQLLNFQGRADLSLFTLLPLEAGSTLSPVGEQISVWRENSFLGPGQLTILKGGGLGFVPDQTKQEMSLEDANHFLVQFPQMPVALDLSAPTPLIEVVFTDRLTRLRATSLRLKDGNVTLEHPAFTSPVQVPEELIRSIRWTLPQLEEKEEGYVWDAFLGFRCHVHRPREHT